MTNRRLDLDGHVVLVTGGGGGLGSGMAQSLADVGAHVVVAGRTQVTLEAVVASIEAGGGSASAELVDLMEPTAVARLVPSVVERYGRLDTLVHAAGHQHRAPVLEYPEEMFDEMLHLHLSVAFRLAQATAAHLVSRQAPGNIILVGSLTSNVVGVRHIVGYAAAKAGLLGLMRTMAVELAAHGIRVNTVAPGFFATAMTQDEDGDPYRRALYGRIPAGRLGEPHDVGDLVAFLASPAAEYVTGQCIAVDGGWSVA